MNVDSVGLTAPRVPGFNIHLCVCQRLAEDRHVRWIEMSKLVHFQESIERSFMVVMEYKT